ncbi:unnamed protein product [Lupinus luteus]|uniref:Uncharacterized protein n=1 Tax=Lupinus luteus TaxID=3873 RepID=A0AAV1VRZ8_LUPLU
MGQSDFPANLPILGGKNWNRWRVQMAAIMGFQEVSEIVEEGLPTLTEQATEEQKTHYKESKKKDCKAMFLLHQCVDEAHFDKISKAGSTKEAWEVMQKCNEGAEQFKKVRLQTMRRQYELVKCPIAMKNIGLFGALKA